MKGNEKIIEHLNARLAEELTAINQYILDSAGNMFFLNIFTDGVFAEKHSLPETKHYCKNSSLFI